MTLAPLRLPLVLAACLAVAACYGGERTLPLGAGSGLTDGDLTGGDARPYPSGCDEARTPSRRDEAGRPAAAPPPALGSTGDLDDILLFPVVLGGPGLSSYDIDCDPDAGPYGACQ